MSYGCVGLLWVEALLELGEEVGPGVGDVEFCADVRALACDVAFFLTEDEAYFV